MSVLLPCEYTTFSHLNYWTTPTHMNAYVYKYLQLVLGLLGITPLPFKSNSTFSILPLTKLLILWNSFEVKYKCEIVKRDIEVEIRHYILKKFDSRYNIFIIVI